MASLRENGTISVSYHAYTDDCIFVKYFPNLRTAYDWIVSQVEQAAVKEKRVYGEYYSSLPHWEMNCSSYEDLIDKFASSETCFYDHSKMVNGKPTPNQNFTVAEDGGKRDKRLLVAGKPNLSYEDALKKEYYSTGLIGKDICYDIVSDIKDTVNIGFVYNDPINKI